MMVYDKSAENVKDRDGDSFYASSLFLLNLKWVVASFGLTFHKSFQQRGHAWDGSDTLGGQILKSDRSWNECVQIFQNVSCFLLGGELGGHVLWPCSLALFFFFFFVLYLTSSPRSSSARSFTTRGCS